MSDQKPAEAAATPATPPAKFTTKYNGKPVEYDLTKPEDVERLRQRAEIGQFAETKTAELREQQRQFEAEKQRLTADAAIGREFQEFLRGNPAQGGIIRDLYQGFREGTLDPSQVRAALAAGKSGDAAALEAQASASGDPEARALLREVASQMKAVESKVESVVAQQSQREKDAAIEAAVLAQEALTGRKAGQDFVRRRTRELVEQGIVAHLAADQATQEYKDVLSESATSERDRLRAQKDLATAKPNAGVPLISEFTKKMVDPKAPLRVQKEQRRSALLAAYQAAKARVGEAVEG